MRKVGFALVLLLLGVAWALPAPAADEKGGWAYQLPKEMMSPYCPGRALSDCPSPQAAELREWIVKQEQAGVSRSEVEQELFRVFGDQLLQAPRAEGMGLMAYLIPALAFAAGGALVAFFLRRQRASIDTAAAAPAPKAPRDPDLERMVEEELRRG
jgi:cytochrome c-type biogenesis protein CcmH/NrfF